MVKFLKKRWYLLLIVAGIFLFLIYQRQTAVMRSSQSKTYAVKRSTLRETLSLSGEIDAAEKQTMRFQTSGRMTWVGVKEGDYVKRFQGLASLDQREVEKNIQKYLNTYSSYRWTYDQSKDDNKDTAAVGITQALRDEAQRLIDKAQFDLNTSVINVELQQLAKEYAYLYTPIEGIVTRVSIPNAGVNVTPAGAEFEVINPNSIYFSLTADQTEVIKLTPGMTGEIIFDAYPDKPVRGTVDYIAFIPKAGETGTAYEVKMQLFEDNADYRYRLGMTGDTEFLLREKPMVIAVPSQYVKTDNKRKYVWKLTAGKKEKNHVYVGAEIDDMTEITSGLREGDIISE
jgi:RND family efflux transporter MFP subunit